MCSTLGKMASWRRIQQQQSDKTASKFTTTTITISTCDVDDNKSMAAIEDLLPRRSSSIRRQSLPSCITILRVDSERPLLRHILPAFQRANALLRLSSRLQDHRHLVNGRLLDLQPPLVLHNHEHDRVRNQLH